MKKLLFTTCLLLACHAARAGDPKAAAAAPASASVSAGPVVDTAGGAAAAALTGSDDAGAVYTPKHKSVFAGSDNDHNPFWPIGWSKSENISAVDAPVVIDPHVEDFAVTTIMLNEPRMAVINGKDMAEGEVAALDVNGQPVIVQLMAVQDGRIILRWQNKNLTVPLHRQENFTLDSNGQIVVRPAATSASQDDPLDSSATLAAKASQQ